MEATQPARRFPVLTDEGESDWISVSAGGNHTCGIKASGSAYCWGDNQFGQTGVASGDTLCGGREQRISLRAHAASGFRRDFTFSRSAPASATRAASPSTATPTVGARTTRARLDSPSAPVPRWRRSQARSRGRRSARGNRTPAPCGATGSSSAGARTRAVSSATVRSRRAVCRCAPSCRASSRRCPPAPSAAARVPRRASCTAGARSGRAVRTDSRSTRAQSTPENVPARAGDGVAGRRHVHHLCGSDSTDRAYVGRQTRAARWESASQDGSTIPLPVANDLQFVQLSAGIVQTCGVATDGVGYCWGDDSFGELGVPPSLIVRAVRRPGCLCTTPQPHRLAALRRNQHRVRQSHLRRDDARQSLLLGTRLVGPTRRWHERRSHLVRRCASSNPVQAP